MRERTGHDGADFMGVGDNRAFTYMTTATVEMCHIGL